MKRETDMRTANIGGQEFDDTDVQISELLGVVFSVASDIMVVDSVLFEFDKTPVILAGINKKYPDRKYICISTVPQEDIWLMKETVNRNLLQFCQCKINLHQLMDESDKPVYLFNKASRSLQKFQYKYLPDNKRPYDDTFRFDGDETVEYQKNLMKEI